MSELLLVAGNRPQFIKLAPLHAELVRRKIPHKIIHTGQHYDHTMSDIFFAELGIRVPDIQLSISSSKHGAMTAELLVALEEVFERENPSQVVVFGDTNSTLAATLAAVKMSIEISHVEAGPRLGTFETPEEVNRVITDHLSNLRFACDDASVQNLEAEGITEGVIRSGDIMYDAHLLARPNTDAVRVRPHQLFVTLHRPQNVDSIEAHEAIIKFISDYSGRVVFPMHPRTRKAAIKFDLMRKYEELDNLRLCEPLGFVDTLKCIYESEVVLTDSGGVQKDAFYARRRSLLLVPAGPWPELVRTGWVRPAGWILDCDLSVELSSMQSSNMPTEIPAEEFGTGQSASIIADKIAERLVL